MNTRKYLHFLTILLITTNSCSFTETEKPKTIVHRERSTADLLKSQQILLTNSARFTKHSGLEGASAFLIRYKNDVYAVTAKHLIGAGGGVEPEIKPADLSKYFMEWKMFPRVAVNPDTDTVSIKKPALNYAKLRTDLLLLEVANHNFKIRPLEVSFAMPTAGDELYIIGCPYAEEDCTQNIYKVYFETYYKESSMLLCSSNEKFDLSGFSGAPLVNAAGSVVGVVISGGEENSTFYIGATFIQEITSIE